MLVVMDRNAGSKEIKEVVNYLVSIGYQAEELPGKNRVAIGVMGNARDIDRKEVARFPGVKELISVTKRYKKVSREFYPDQSVVEVNGARFGGEEPVIIGGPCAVESEAQILASAEFIAEQGGKILRGGIQKPRTSPYDFQGMGFQGLSLMRKAADKFGLAICVELLDGEDLPVFEKSVDIIQVGARNMQNFSLLKKLSKIKHPILLKRGNSATVEEFLLAAEYLLDGGNDQIILCERGIRTFETSTRNTLDLNSVALIRKRSHLPIIVDPCHAAGVHDLVTPLALASISAGAQGLLIETHPNPLQAKSDAQQQLDFPAYANLVNQVGSLSEFMQPKENLV